MSDRSKIEWTDATWNPVRARALGDGGAGWHCEHVNEGCRNCYAETINRRLGTGLDYKSGAIEKTEIILNDKILLAPLFWKKPCRVSAGSATDLFGDWVKDEWLDQIFGVMALCPRHTFQVLTKRPRRMRAWVCQTRIRTAVIECVAELYVSYPEIAGKIPFDIDRAINIGLGGWPPPNVWLGVSAEDQATADERIPDLLATPAAVRFVNCEPLLGPIDIRQWRPFLNEHAGIFETMLNWVICGGEFGHGARPMHPDWARSLRDQCACARVPFFFKQWGEWTPHKVLPGGNLSGDCRTRKVRIVHPSGMDDMEISKATGGHSTELGSLYMAHIGKNRAGRFLDGRTHNEFPAK